MGLGTTTIKYILFFFNFAFALSGLALVALGMYIRYYASKSEVLANKVTGDTAGLAALCIIIIGGAVFVVSFFGCCGAIRESHCMITLYAMFLLAIFLLEVAVGVFLYVNRDQAEAITRKSMTIVLDDYKNKTEARVFFDEIQHDFHCCGVDGPQDWVERTATSMPNSCCRSDGGPGTTCPKSETWQDGCLNKIVNMFKANANSLFKVIMLIAGGEVKIETISPPPPSSDCYRKNLSGRANNTNTLTKSRGTSTDEVNDDYLPEPRLRVHVTSVRHQSAFYASKVFFPSSFACLVLKPRASY